ncbi:MAG: hypothetical protein ACRES9_07745 [Gammaproteobacteria bacterium]
MHNGDDSSASIPVTEGALRALEKTRSWVLFLGIMSVIGAVLFGLSLLIGTWLLTTHGSAGIIVVVEGAIFIPLAVLLAVFWLRYSGALKKVSSGDEPSAAVLDDAFVRQRRLWILQGVVLVILVLLSVAFIIFAPTIAHMHP